VTGDQIKCFFNSKTATVNTDMVDKIQNYKKANTVNTGYSQ